MIPLKQWRIEQAIRLGVSITCFNSRFYKYRKYRGLKLKRVNRRVVFVVVNKLATSGE
jgi:hypothetical protein